MEEKNNSQLVAQQTAPVSFNFFDPQQFQTMQRVCSLFAHSELVPEMYRVSDKNPEKKAIANCMIAVSMSMRTGADPLMVMQNMVIIYGRPSWSSKFLISTVNTSGRFNPLQYRFTEKGMLGKVEYTDYEWNNSARRKEAVTKIFDGTKIMDIECVAYTTAKGSGDVLESSPVSIRMAIQEGWYTKAGSKWQTMSKQMLMYRTASFWTNAYAPELSMGMKTEEEVRDIVDVEFEDVTVKVEREKAEKANKKSFGFPQNSEVEDAETGEVKEPETTPTVEKVEPKVEPQAQTQTQAQAQQGGELFDKCGF